jgi:glycosyltransferase involved in cell wall biosynthesis
MEKLPVSLVIITINEEDTIAKCINSVPWASDIVILDSGSDDKTLEIAKGLGARVFTEEWRGYGPQKRRAVELSQHEWVLCLDADEALSKESSQELFGLIKAKRFTHDSFAIPRKTFHLGKWIMHGGWYPDYQVRFFRKTKCQWSNDSLHEHVEGSGVGFLQNPLEHYAFDDLYDQVRTNNKYSTLGARSLFQKKVSFYTSNLIIKPFIKFIECFIIKKGYKDGIPGYIIAIGAAYSSFLKYAKLWESYSVPNKNKAGRQDVINNEPHIIKPRERKIANR